MFILPFRKYIFEICYSLNTDIIFLHHQILKKGWIYYDLKIDNLGYIKNNDKLKLFFIDEESGLKKIESLEFEEYLNIHGLNTYLASYSILGQYNLKNIFGMDFKNYYPKFDEKQNIIDYLTNNNFIIHNTNNYFNWIQIYKSCINNFWVIQFVMGFYRLVSFDDYGRHMSNPQYNNYFKSIDELFYSLEPLYIKLNNFKI